MKKIFLLAFFLGVLLSIQAQNQQIDLSGLWRFQLDPMGFGKTPGSELYLCKLSETIYLPGSTDEGGKGISTSARYVDRLTRKYEYQGAAWYQREVSIPADWEGKRVLLTLERCHWETTVYVDGTEVGIDERLSTPHYYDLTKQLKPGLHNLTICVNNNLKYPLDQWTHGTTEYTQTNWNGIVGDLKLEAKSPVYLRQIQVYPKLSEKSVEIKPQLVGLSKDIQAKLELTIREKSGKTIVLKSLKTDSISLAINPSIRVSLGKNIKLWNEFTPNLYEVTVTVVADGMRDAKTVTFGMRSVTQGKHHVQINGRNIHLRGVLDCCVFPKTGYPSTKVSDWKRIMTTIRSYGMNHIRFHSWCPPEAAFVAADELGMYLQAELPMWIKDVGKYPARRDFFEKEMYAILDAYGNHPSFILMCNGNENEGDFDVLEDLVVKAQKYDDRRLYSASTARTHVKADQYYTSHVTKKGWITVYNGKPNTDWDCSKESDIDVPVIAHETGQRCMYPNFDEIQKYDGVLQPRNFEVFRERLTEKGMLHQANDFFKATGAHTVLQYKEVNEALFRTANSGGFQLLGLADFPGQGSAFVGILDAFWESKGLVTPEKYRESCDATVLLARFPKRTYSNEELINLKLELYHYGEKALRNKKISWKLLTTSGDVLCKDDFKVKQVEVSTVTPLKEIKLPLSAIKEATKVTFKVELEGVTKNEWDFWVYPKVEKEECIVVREWDEKTKSLLFEGKNVLLIPKKVDGRKTNFTSHFWNPIMFRWAPMIVGTRISSDHPALAKFPTSYYADWQWWDILNYTTAMDLNAFRELTPIIQSVDTYEFNDKLGIAFETKVGKGKLFVLALDIEKNWENRLAAHQLLYSIKKYVNSSEFNPKISVEPSLLDMLFSLQKKQKKEKENDAVKQLLNR